MRHWRLILIALLGLGAVYLIHRLLPSQHNPFRPPDGAVYLIHRFLPSQHNPFRPPDLAEPIGLATYNKLTALKYDEDLCRTKLVEAGVEFTVLGADGAEAKCPLEQTLSLKKSLTPYNAAPLRMTCHQMARQITCQ